MKIELIHEGGAPQMGPRYARLRIQYGDRVLESPTIDLSEHPIHAAQVLHDFAHMVATDRVSDTIKTPAHQALFEAADLARKSLGRDPLDLEELYRLGINRGDILKRLTEALKPPA